MAKIVLATVSEYFDPESFLYTLFLSLLSGVTPLSIDMSLPALVAIANSLKVPSASAGLTLSFFLAGIALGPIVLGPLSDRYGRQPILLIGSVLFTLGGLGCALSGSLPVLLICRLLAGIGAGAGSALSLAIVRDLFDGPAARAKLSYVATVGTLAPMIAPTLGALVLTWIGWRGIYGLLTVSGALLIGVVWSVFRESLAHPDVTAMNPRQLLVNYGRVVRNPVTLGYSLVASLTFGGLFSYISSSPLVMMGLLGLSPRIYGWTFAATAFGIMLGAFINGRLNARGLSEETLLTFGLVTSTCSSLALVLIAYLGGVQLGTVLPLLMLSTCCVGFIGPNANQGVLHLLPDIAGVASAVLGSLRMLVGAFAGALVSVVYDGHTLNAMAGLMTFFSIAALAAYVVLVRTPISRGVRTASPHEVH